MDDRHVGDTPQPDQEDPVFIPAEVGLKALRSSSGELCWRYMGLGRGWHAWFNEDTGYYEVAVSANVPEPTEDGVTVRVETKQHWRFGAMDMREFWPSKWHARLEPVGYDQSPFPELDDPEDAPRRVPNGK